MGTTSDKLTYLAGTKDKLKTAINYTGASITNDTFRSYPEKLYDAYLDILNNGTSTIISNLPKVEGTGKSLQLNNTVYAPLQDFKMYGDTQQDSTTGKNKLNIASQYSLTGTKVETINEIPSGTYILSCSSNDSPSDNSSRFQFRDSNGNEVGLVYLDTSHLSRSVTLSANASQVNIYSRGTWSASQNVTLNVKDLMLSTSGGDYEPYTNGASPNPDYPQPIQVVTGRNDINVCGKNLLNINDVSTSNALSYSVNGDVLTLTTTTANTNSYVKYIITNVLPSTQYNLSGSAIADNNKSIVIRNYKTDGSYDTVLNVNKETINDNFTTTSDVDYLSIFIYSGTSSSGASVGDKSIYTNLMISTSGGDYKPYTSVSQEINLGKNLLNITPTTNSGVTGTYDSSTGALHVEGVASATYPRFTTKIPLNIPTNTTLTLSIQSVLTYMLYIRYYYDSSQFEDTYIPIGDKSVSYTLTHNCIKVEILGRIGTNNSVDDTLYIQLEKGSQATTYSAYFTPIELCKISTYQDYIYKTNDKWYIHKEIGKVVLNGSESWTAMWTATGRYAYRTDIANILQTTSQEVVANLFSNLFKAYSQIVLYHDSGDDFVNYGIGQRINQSQIIVKNNDTTSVNDFKTWLSTHNTIVYYVLNEATETEITNSELVGQLENLISGKSCNGVTNVSQDTSDLESYIYIKTIKEYDL